MINLLRSGWAFVTSKARLILEYGLIVAVVALGSWSVATWWQNRETVQGLTKNVADLSGRLGTVKADLATAVKTNVDQDNAIAEIKRLRDLDGKTLSDLQDELKKPNARGAAVRQRVSQLETTNATAKALLDTAVPPDVGCVLDGTPCPGASRPDPDGGGAGKAR